MTYVHTGLDPSRSAEAQIEALKGRNPFAPILLKEGDPSRIQAFCERSKVRHMHPQLTGKALLVSGHHGMTQIGAFLSLSLSLSLSRSLVPVAIAGCCVLVLVAACFTFTCVCTAVKTHSH